VDRLLANLAQIPPARLASKHRRVEQMEAPDRRGGGRAHILGAILVGVAVLEHGVLSELCHCGRVGWLGRCYIWDWILGVFFIFFKRKQKMWTWMWFQMAKLILTYLLVRLVMEFVGVVDELVRLVSKIIRWCFF